MKVTTSYVEVDFKGEKLLLPFLHYEKEVAGLQDGYGNQQSIFSAPKQTKKSMKKKAKKHTIKYKRKNSDFMNDFTCKNGPVKIIRPAYKTVDKITQ
jgi:hypothetical protein